MTIDHEVAKVSGAVIERCSAIEVASGFGCHLASKSPSALAKLERNFFYLALVRSMAESYSVSSLSHEYALSSLEAGIYFLYQHVMYMDGAVDRRQATMFVGSSAYLVLAMDQLALSLPSPEQLSAVRRIVFNRLHRTLVTVEMERFEGPVPHWTYEEYAAIARHKCSMADLVPFAVHAVVGNGYGTESIRDDQVRALEHVHVGMQWIDDLADLAHDRNSRQPSLLWSRLDAWAAEECIDLTTVDDTQLRQFAYVSGLAKQSLKESIREFELAMDLMRDQGSNMFIRTLAGMTKAQVSNCHLIDSLLAKAKIKATA